MYDLSKTPVSNPDECELSAQIADVRYQAQMNQFSTRNRFSGDGWIGDNFSLNLLWFPDVVLSKHVCIQIGLHCTASIIATLASSVNEFSIV